MHLEWQLDFPERLIPPNEWLRSRWNPILGCARVRVRNFMPNEAEEEWLSMMARADVTVVAAGGNFHIGLCNQAPLEVDILASITTEPTSAGGYARQTVARNATGFPVEGIANNVRFIQSQQVTFTASGADFSRTFTRAFICNVASGAGILLGYSGALSEEVLVVDGASFPMYYEMHMN